MNNSSKSLIEKFHIAGWLDNATMVEMDEGGGAASLKFSKLGSDSLVGLAGILLALEKSKSTLTPQEFDKLREIAYRFLKARLEGSPDSGQQRR